MRVGFAGENPLALPLPCGPGGAGIQPAKGRYRIIAGTMAGGNPYGEDLAFIHDAGFSGCALGAAPGILRLLKAAAYGAP